MMMMMVLCSTAALQFTLFFHVIFCKKKHKIYNQVIKRAKEKCIDI